MAAKAGPFYLAYVNAGTPFNPAVHNVMDEYVVTFTLEHAEGQNPTLEMLIKNPRIGLLNPSRKRWVWFSWFNGSEIVPLINCELVGVPSGIQSNLITVQFIALPTDFVAQKAVLAAALKVRPGWDPVFIDEKLWNDSDAVLEGYSSNWHTDRVSLVVSTSDIINPEDGFEEFTVDKAFYDSFNLEIGAPPLLSVQATATVTWAQGATGEVNFGARNFSSYGDGIASSWPKTGEGLSGGWHVANASAIGSPKPVMVTLSYSWQNNAKTHRDMDLMSINSSNSFPVGNASAFAQTSQVSGTTGFAPDPAGLAIGDAGFVQGNFDGTPSNFEVDTGTAASINVKVTTNYVAHYSTTTTLVLGYELKQGRKESITFTLNADLQEVISNPDASQAEVLSWDGQDVGLPTADASTPIADPSYDSYFQQDRGHWSIENRICVARAHILKKCRVVTATWNCSFPEIVSRNMSCRKGAIIHDPRCPGGIASGKVMSYKMTGDGNSGQLRGIITIGCAIGKDTVITTTPGTGLYGSGIYMDNTYQQFSGQTVILPSTEDVSYSLPVGPTGGLSGMITAADVIVSETIGDSGAQLAAVQAEIAKQKLQQRNTITNFNQNPLLLNQEIIAAQLAAAAVADVVTANPVGYELEILPMDSNKVEVTYPLDLSVLSIGKQIDLSAAST